MEPTSKWKQRFANFSAAYVHLKYAVEEVLNPNDLEKEGTIQRFEFTHELAWKVMKDFLKEQGIQGIIGSKDATRNACHNELITDGHVWMDMIESRNKTLSTYLESILEEEYRLINNVYFPLFNAFHEKMKTYL
ncbi:MAG: nucleotidyltransferase substrate binding protein [Chitinophagaceae bacterium]